MNPGLKTTGTNNHIANDLKVILLLSSLSFLFLIVVLTGGCLRKPQSPRVIDTTRLLVSYTTRTTFHNMDLFEATTISVASDGRFTRVHKRQDNVRRIDCGLLAPETRDDLDKLVRRAAQAHPNDSYRDTGDGPQANYTRHREILLPSQNISIEDWARVPEELSQLMTALDKLSCPK